MSLADGVRLALRALAANKLRTSLTVLGMVIGVAAVIALMSLGAGAQASIESNIRGTGSNLLFISPGVQAQTGGRFVDVSATTPTLTLEDSEAIRDAAIPGIVEVAPTRSTGASLVAEGNAFSTQIIGATPSYAEVRSFQPQAGRFITNDDLDRRARVIALGQSLAIDLFAGQNPIGATLRLNNQTFTVIAVMEESGQATFQSRDNQALVPLTTLQTRISPSRTLAGDDIVTEISVTLADEDESTIEAVTDELSALLRLRHDVLEDDFTIRTQQDIIEALGEVTGTLTLFLGAIAGISLLVGGIGIMNIMLVSVTERTREIGIRKAIGARRRDILMQFLIEAVLVSLGGGIAGAIIGGLLATFMGGVSFGGRALEGQLTPEPVILALAVSVAIGLVFGIDPANRAARLRPIEALRYE